MASTPIWELLDRLEAIAPDVGRFYSVGRGATGERQWQAYVERVAGGRAGTGTSIHHATAIPDRRALLQENGLRGICYTINDFDQGVALVEQGARGLTTDRLDLIGRWRQHWPTAA